MNKKCLKSILDQTQGSEIIEINIIDNNSTDTTKDYVTELQKKFPEVNYFVERKGKELVMLEIFHLKYVKVCF